MLLKLFLHAQAPLFSHQKWYRVEDGLPQSFVVDIHQDETGFIWLATRDGLARFDGRSFKTWKNDPNDTTTLAGNVVQEMFRLENGRFIIFFQGNIVDELDPVTGKVRHLTSDPMIAGYFQKGRRFLFPKSNQWFYHYEKEKGIGIIDLVHPEKNTFYNARNILQKEDSVVGSYLHPDGRLWMVTPTGIYRMDSSRTKVNWHPYGQRQEMTKPFRVRPAEVFLAWDEWLVISSLDALYFWNIHNHRLQKVDLVAPANTQYRFPGYFQTDAAGFLYFRRGPGVYRMDRSLQQPVLVWENQIVPGRSITGCLVDRTGTLWVGVDAAGLMKVNLKTMPLTSMPYKGTFHQTALELQGFSAAQLPDGWLDTRYGSYYFRYAYSPEGKLYVTYSFGVPVADRQLFVATNKTFKPLPMPPGPVLTYFRGITFDSSGSIYAYNENGNELYSWKNDETLPEITKLFPPDSIGMIDVADAKMLDDVLWMSTYGEGLLKIKKGKVVAHYSGRNGGRLKMPDNLTHINIDPVEKDIVWIGSLGGGLVKMSRTGGILEILTTKDGLPNNTVYCMENDHDGNIWLSTNNGLVRFSPSTRSMHVFYRSDGLPGNEFNRSHSMKLTDGRLAFGGPDGLVVFDPKNFEPISGKFDTRLTITDVEVNGKQLLEKLDTQLLKGPLANLKELELPYHQNYLGVSFAALLFNEPQKTKYRYRLLPDEKDWNETGNNAYARYTQLRPGRYILEMNATGLDGEWSGQIKKLEIVIHPPFWNTWYAWLFYAVVVAGLVRYAVTNRIKQLKAREQVAFEHREAQRLRELEKMKDTFFSNITHELRTPLTLIKTPLDELASNESLPAPARKTIDTARRNSQSLLRLINQLLDINKLEAGQLKVINAIGQPVLFVRECLEPFASAAAAKGIAFETHYKGLGGNWHFDADKWEKILYNLVSNAIKFTPVGGKVEFEMSESIQRGETSGVMFRVKDTGIGMSGDDTERVFDRYYRARSAEAHFAGTGIGMALVKELVKMLEGDIEVSSRVGAGTEFRVWLPVKRAAASAMTDITPAEKDTTGQITLNGDPFTKDESAGATKPAIVLAEDYDDLRSFISENLESGYRITALPDGLAAWHTIEEALPDLVITDMMMPGLDGNELCRRIKQGTSTAHIPVVMLTSRTAAEARLMGRGAGADVYLTKPFQVEELRLCLRNLLEQQERQRQYWKKEMLETSPVLPTPADEFSERLFSFLNENLDEPNLGVEMLASHMGMSRSTINRKMQSVMGMGTNDFIRHYRLKKAASILLAGYDVSQAAYQTGFSSPSYFSQRFREFFGKTPSEYASGGHLTQN